MIKSVNQLVTQRCNSKCKMCGIWKEKFNEEMSPKEFNKFYSHPEFKEIEDLCISGGEPTLRKDLIDVIDNILTHLPKLRMLFMPTNASNPKIAKTFVKRYSSFIEDIYVCPSIEGERETQKKIRGVDSYNNVIELVDEIQNLGLQNSHVILSTTIIPENCNKKSLDHIISLAKYLGCNYSFRISSKNDGFYHNEKHTDISLSEENIDFLKLYMGENKVSDPFFDILFNFLEGKKTIMGDRKTRIECLAGDISIFVKPNGIIYPCINSSRIIGDKKNGLYSVDYRIGNKEKCPCCTEGQIYPMLNFHQYSSRRKQND